MRKLFYLLTALTIIGCKSNTLKITIDDVDKGKAYLYNTIIDKVDSIEFSGHSFSFNLTEIKEPTLFYLMFDEINSFIRPIYIILSNQETQIKFSDLVTVDENTGNCRNLYPNRPKFISDPNNNEAFYLFQDLWIDFSNSVTKPELDLDKRKELYTRFISESEEMIIKNHDKLVAAFMMEYLMNNNLLQLEKIQLLYSYLTPDIQKTKIGQRISDEVGFQAQTFAPKFSLQDFHGNKYSLDSLKGKKVLLHFWSTSCAPCIKEIPDLLRLNDKNNDLVIINISFDRDSITWFSGMERLGLIDMINYCDYLGSSGKIAKDYQIHGIPANYLIDENGKILSKAERIQVLIEKL